MDGTGPLLAVQGSLVSPGHQARYATACGPINPLSYARYDQVRTTDLHLDLKADFAKKTLAGHAELTLDWLDKNARTPRPRHARTDHLEDRSDRCARALVARQIHARQIRREKGQALHIACRQAPKVRIYYRTAPTASALQWLTPAQTLSGKRPFMFSQSQTINARSWAPVQDTPAVRFTYTARIEAPAGLRVVMSADNDPKATGKGGWKFNMPQADSLVPAGDRHRRIEARTLGPRTGVYAEPKRIDAAAYRTGRHREDGGSGRRRCTARIAGDVTTCWCCRRRSRSAAWKTRA
jgi:leukotriene-A4 hydrolase